MTILRQVLHLVVLVYLLVMLGRLVLEWVRLFGPGWRPRGAALVVAEILYSLTDPPLAAIRRVVPTVTVGSVRLDLAFPIILICLYFLLAIL